METEKKVEESVKCHKTVFSEKVILLTLDAKGVRM